MAYGEGLFWETPPCPLCPTLIPDPTSRVLSRKQLSQALESILCEEAPT